MRLTLTTIVGINTCFEGVRTPPPVRFRDGPLARHPCRRTGRQPGASAGHVADHATHPDGTSLALLVVPAAPAPHRLTAGPGGVVPDQQQRGAALSGALGRAPRSHIAGPCPHGAPCPTPAPSLVCLRRSRPHQPSITGQRRGLGIVRRGRHRRQVVGDRGGGPAMVVGRGEPAPPDVVANAQRPRGLGQRPLDQAVAPVLWR
jgi:hypothetical protein